MARTEDRTHARGSRVPASKDMLRWVIAHFDLDNYDEMLVAIALVTGGANVFAADDELCPGALVMRLHRQRPEHVKRPGSPLLHE